VIGIDVGGANLKVADGRGSAVHYCPLWTGAPIADLLRPYGGEEAAVVMSGELADCFASKAEGVAFIVDEVRSVLPGARFYGTDGEFHDGPAPCLAAANWLASADWLRAAHPGAVLLDVGSTTADIVPLRSFDRLRGLTDLGRLQRGYLLYTGMLRTTVPAIVRTVELGGVRTPVASEHFAQSGDVHIVLGHIGPGDYTCDAPDGGLRTREGALRRLARVVCADLEELGEEGARSIAEQVWTAQANEVRQAVADAGGLEVVVAGIGAPTFAPVVGGAVLPAPIADALPAHAVRALALRAKMG
jgi:(4-(4-[2-(gamma-L-glutamylamino)ethyl]phenoxymethyl)furan-2-yl)methanamine synthase